MPMRSAVCDQATSSRNTLNTWSTAVFLQASLSGSRRRSVMTATICACRPAGAKRQHTSLQRMLQQCTAQCRVPLCCQGTAHAANASNAHKGACGCRIAASSADCCHAMQLLQDRLRAARFTALCAAQQLHCCWITLAPRNSLLCAGGRSRLPSTLCDTTAHLQRCVGVLHGSKATSDTCKKRMLRIPKCA